MNAVDPLAVKNRIKLLEKQWKISARAPLGLRNIDICEKLRIIYEMLGLQLRIARRPKKNS